MSCKVSVLSEKEWDRSAFAETGPFVISLITDGLQLITHHFPLRPENSKQLVSIEW